MLSKTHQIKHAAINLGTTEVLEMVTCALRWISKTRQLVGVTTEPLEAEIKLLQPFSESFISICIEVKGDASQMPGR